MRRAPSGLIVRRATTEDGEALIALELSSPVVVGEVEETYDRSPDYFAASRVQGEHRTVLGEVDGHVIAVMAGVIQAPLVRGAVRRLAYIHRARVHPDFHGRRVAWAMANHLFSWAGTHGAEGPYYLIAPGNRPSNEFVERGGGRWPVDVTLLELDVTEAQAGQAEKVPEKRLAEVAGLVNATHAGEDFFEPLTVDSLASRLGRDRQYTVGNLRGVYRGGALVAVAGLWDRGATAQRIIVNRATGATARSRSAAVADWGFAPGHEDAFVQLLRRLAAEARTLGRSSLMICEPRPGALPDTGAAWQELRLALYTPTIAPSSAEAIRGLYIDLLCV